MAIKRQFVFVYVIVADNKMLYQNLALSLSGELYVPRGDGPDFESPQDGNKDNIYEFVFKVTFSDLKLTQEQWGGYNVDWETQQDHDIAFTVF